MFYKDYSIIFLGTNRIPRLYNLILHLYCTLKLDLYKLDSFSLYNKNTGMKFSNMTDFKEITVLKELITSFAFRRV